MYDYRHWTPAERDAAVERRIQRGFPWHGPPHIDAPGQFRIVSASCFEHCDILHDESRLSWFEQQLLRQLAELDVPCAAWVVLPNHYHVLVRIADIRSFSTRLGQLHGRTSFEMNKQDGTRGRKAWHRSQDRCMRSEAHYCVTLNYIHNNPVKHGLVKKWTDWPFSSAHWYLATKGRDWLRENWLNYPVLNYGEKWDP